MQCEEEEITVSLMAVQVLENSMNQVESGKGGRP